MLLLEVLDGPHVKLPGSHPRSGTSQHASPQGADGDPREVGKRPEQEGGTFGSWVGKHLPMGPGHRAAVKLGAAPPTDRARDRARPLPSQESSSNFEM